MLTNTPALHTIRGVPREVDRELRRRARNFEHILKEQRRIDRDLWK